MIPFGLATKLGAVLAILLAVHFVLRAERQKGREECQAQYQALALEAAQENQRLTQIAVDKNRGITDGLRKQLEREKARAADNSALVDRLRIAIDEASAGDIGTSDPAARLDAYAERAGVFGELLAESAGLLEEGRGKVAELAAKTAALQAFIQQVCVR